MNVPALNNKLTEDLMLNKEDVIVVLHSLEAYYRRLMEDSSDSNFYEKLLIELAEFTNKVDSSNFPAYIAPPWCYYVDININCFDVGIGVLNTLELSDDKEDSKVYKKTFVENIDNKKNYILNFFEEYSFLKHIVPKLSVDEFAKKNNLSPISIRQYIRDGLIKGAEKQGRDWAIPLLASINRKKDENAIYEIVGELNNIPIKYKYLETQDVTSIILRWPDETSKKCEVILMSGWEKHAKEECVEMTKKEMKEFEQFLISNSSFEYHEPKNNSLGRIWMKSHINSPSEISERYLGSLAFYCGMFYLNKPVKVFDEINGLDRMLDLTILFCNAREAD